MVNRPPILRPPGGAGACWAGRPGGSWRWPW